jgi:hypothetical protein
LLAAVLALQVQLKPGLDFYSYSYPSPLFY